MYSTGLFLQEMFILYSLALLGFIMRKAGVLNEHTSSVLTQLILYITLPALILFSLDTAFSFTLVKDFIWLLTMSAYILLLSVLLAYWLRKRSNLPQHQHSVFEGLIIFGNQGFIGYAISYMLFAEEGIIYLTMFNIFYFILIWTYGIHLFTKSKDSIDWKKIFLNPGIFSTSIGLLFFFFPISWPTMISSTLESVGKMTIPLSMILIGVLVANVYYKEFIDHIKNIHLWMTAIVKLLIIPLLLLPFAAFPVPFTLLVIAILVSGMPSASTISLYAQRFGGDTFFASLSVLLSTILCIVTIPFLYFLITFFFAYD